MPATGVPPYTYAVIQDAGGGMVDESGMFTPGAPGDYTIMVTDSIGNTGYTTAHFYMDPGPPAGGTTPGLMIMSDLLHSLVSRSLDDLYMLAILVAVRTLIAYFLNQEIRELRAAMR